MKKDHSPFTCDSSGDRKQGGNGFRKDRPGFLLAIGLMFVAAALLAVAAGNRTADVAWGGLADSAAPEEFILPSSGFIVVDMSNVYPESVRQSSGSRGFLSPVIPGMGISGESGQEKKALSWLPREDFADDRFAGNGSPSVFSGGSVSSGADSSLQWPSGLNVDGGASGVSESPFSNAGKSRLSGFSVRMPENLPVEGASFGISGMALVNSGESRLPSFSVQVKSTSPASAAETEKEQGEEKNVPPAEDSLPGKMESDYEDIVLSAASDGKNLPEEEDPENSADEEEVVLTEVKPQWKEHLVKAGQTMSDIALEYGVSMSDIVKANELKDPNRLSEKQLLLVPENSDAVEATLEEVLLRKARVAAAKEKVVPVKVTAYVVAAGDSLWTIASSQKLEIDTLFGCNDLKNPDRLKPGMTLRIPNQDGIFYTIKKGDALGKIASNYGIPLDRIRKANDKDVLSPLIPGKEIFLPGARPEAVSEPAAKKSRSSRTSSSAKKNSVTISTSSRSYRWPVVGRINSPFGWRRHPVTRRRDFHTGIDIKAPRGRAITASKSGVVEYSGWMGGYGRVLVIRHGDGYSTLYAHCSSLSVRKGQSVSQGQTVAHVGTTGRTTGPHLHFEIRKGKSPVNPLRMLR